MSRRDGRGQRRFPMQMMTITYDKTHLLHTPPAAIDIILIGRRYYAMPLSSLNFDAILISRENTANTLMGC